MIGAGQTRGGSARPLNRAYGLLREASLEELFIYAMILVSPLIVYRVDVAGINLSLQRILILLAAGTWVTRRILDRNFTLPQIRPALIVLGAFTVFLAYEILQLPFTQQAGYAYWFVFNLLSGLFIISVMVLILDSRRKLKIALLAFLGSATVPLIVGLYQSMVRQFGYSASLPFADYLSPDRMFLGNFRAVFGDIYVPRITGTLATPAYYGEYLVYISIFVIAFVLHKRLRTGYKLAAAALLSITSFGILATVSRSAWILMILGVFGVVFHTKIAASWAFLRARVSRWVLPTVIAGFLGLVVLAGFPLATVIGASAQGVSRVILTQEQPTPSSGNGSAGPTDTADTAGSTGKNSAAGSTGSTGKNSAAGSTTAHLRLRGEALQVFAQHPVLGVGLGNLGVEIGQKGVSSAHTWGFTILAEGGIVGEAIFLTFLGALLFFTRRAYLTGRRDPEWKAYVLGLYVVIALLVLNNILLYDSLFRDTSWVIMGLALVASSVLSTKEPAGRVR